jgi:hypothetical protein
MAFYSPYFRRWKMKIRMVKCYGVAPLSLQEEFTPCTLLRGAARSTDVVARAVVEPSRDIESLPLRSASGIFDGGRILAV